MKKVLMIGSVLLSLVLSGCSGCSDAQKFSAPDGPNPAADTTAAVAEKPAGKLPPEATKGIALIDFNATWCGPCKALSPILDEVEKAYAGRVNFFRIDVDENAQLAMDFEAEAIPLLVFLKDGKEADRIVGLCEKETIQEKLDALL